MFAEGNASLARSASLDAGLLALPAPPVSGLLSGRLKLGTFFFFCNFSFSLFSLDRSTDVGTELSTCVMVKTKNIPKMQSESNECVRKTI